MMSRRHRDFRHGESHFKHFRNGKLVKNEEDPLMHFPRRTSFFADDPDLEDVAQSLPTDNFDDAEYEDLLRKYSDGGTYSSINRAQENQRQVQNVKDKINNMKKKFQSLAMVCDYVDGMERYEKALEADPDSKMVKDLTSKLENLKNTPKVHTNEFSYSQPLSDSLRPGAAPPKQYGVSLSEKRRRAAQASANQMPPCQLTIQASCSHSRAASPCRPSHDYHHHHQLSNSLQVPPHCHPVTHGHQASGHNNCHPATHRLSASPASSQQRLHELARRPETKDVGVQAGRPRLSSDSDEEKIGDSEEDKRDSGISTHDEDEERGKTRKKMDNRLKRELLKPKFYMDDSGNLVRVSSEDSLDEVKDGKTKPPIPPTKPSKVATSSPSTLSVPVISIKESSTVSSTSTTAPKEPKVFFDPVASSSRALLLFLRLTNIPFEACPVQLKSGDQFQPEFQRISPQHRLPVMDDSGFVLREGVSICRYLAESRQVSAQWRPNEKTLPSNSNDDLKARARMDEYFSWHQSQLRPVCLQIFSQATLAPILTHRRPNYARLRGLQIELAKQCDHLESLLSEGDFIGGNSVGLQDLFAICELMQAFAAGFDIRHFCGRRIRIWMDRVKKETGEVFEEIHGDIMKIWETRGRKIADELEEFLLHH